MWREGAGGRLPPLVGAPEWGSESARGLPSPSPPPPPPPASPERGRAAGVDAHGGPPAAGGRRYWTRRRLDDWLRAAPRSPRRAPADAALAPAPRTPTRSPSPAPSLSPARSPADAFADDEMEPPDCPEYPYSRHVYKPSRVRESRPAPKPRKSRARQTKKEITLADLSTNARIRSASEECGRERLRKKAGGGGSSACACACACAAANAPPRARVRFGSDAKKDQQVHPEVKKKKKNMNEGFKEIYLLSMKRLEDGNKNCPKRLNAEEESVLPQICIPTTQGDDGPISKIRKTSAELQKKISAEHANKLAMTTKLPCIEQIKHTKKEIKNKRNRLDRRSSATPGKEKPAVTLPPVNAIQTPPEVKLQRENHRLRLQAAIAKALEKSVNSTPCRWPSLNAGHISQAHGSKLPYCKMKI